MLVLAGLMGCGGDAPREPAKSAASSSDLSPGQVETLKAACPFLKAGDARGMWYGTATLFRRDGDTGYLLTSARLVSRAPKVTVVFGSGSPGAREVEASLVSFDTDRDLACLRIKADGLPEPLELAAGFGATETATLFAAAHPPQSPSPGPGPAVWLPRVNVLSLQRNPAGGLDRVLLGGDAPQGATGGPVVGTDLRVRAVFVPPKTPGTTLCAVPADAFARFFTGRVSGAAYKPGPAKQGSVTVAVSIATMDPFGTVADAGVAWVRRDRVASLPVQNADGTWPRADAAMQDVPLPVNPADGLRRGEFALQKEPSDRDAAIYLFQTWWKLKDGTGGFSAPEEREIVFSDGVVAGAVEEAPPEMKLGDKIQAKARFAPRSALTDLHLCQDGERLFVLDLSDGRILRLSTGDLSVQASAAVAEDAIAMSLNPREDTIYVVARDSTVPEARKDYSGVLQVFRASTLELVRTLPVPGNPIALASSDEGLVAVGTRESGLVIVDAAGSRGSERVEDSRNSSWIRIHPDQQRLYSGDSGSSPGDFRRVVFVRPSGYSGRLESRDSRYHGDYPLGGDLEISQDGKFLAGSGGAVLRLSRQVDADMIYAAKTEAWSAAAFAAGRSTLLVATNEGFLKQYSTPGFELRGSWKLGRRCLFLQVDPRSGVVFAVTVALDKERYHRDGPWKRVISEVESWSIESR